MKLFYLILGCTPANRHTEQHDVFFCIGRTLSEIVPEIKKFWSEANGKIHIDAWREVNIVNGFSIAVEERTPVDGKDVNLYFINLGGYRQGDFEEYHYKLLHVCASISGAVAAAKNTAFYKTFSTSDKGGASHIDDKYGVDIDEVLNVQDILPQHQKQQYRLVITPSDDGVADELHIGYLKLSSIE